MQRVQYVNDIRSRMENDQHLMITITKGYRRNLIVYSVIELVILFNDVENNIYIGKQIEVKL